MTSKTISDAITNISTEYIEKAADYSVAKKAHKPAWLKWGTMAACLCLVCIVVISFVRTEHPTDTDLSQAPNVVINSTTYFQSAHQIAFEKCPNGFEYGGVIENGTAESCSYYINPQMPEWIYVKQETKLIGTADDFYIGYVRYVDESIRGKEFIIYDGAIYVSMLSAEYPSVVDKALYDEIDSTYGRVIAASSVDGFLLVGTTAFEGFDVIPYNDFGSNTHQKEEQIYANPDNENVILLSTSWETSSGVQAGFDVYIKTDYNYTRHENAEMFVYDGRYFSISDLSAETVEWLQWYNALSPENQLAVSYEPYELRPNDESSYTIDAESTTNVADVAPMVYVNDTLYKQSTAQTSYAELNEEFVYLGEIGSEVISDRSISDGIPNKNFQANHSILGSKVYQYGDDIVVEINGKYWLYENYTDERTE